MISLLFIALAAICKAVVDTCGHHFDTSVFKWLPRKFWDGEYKRYEPQFNRKYKWDAWHIFNSGMITMLLIAWVCYKQQLFLFSKVWLNKAAEVGIGGVVFILVFNLFYNVILRRK